MIKKKWLIAGLLSLSMLFMAGCGAGDTPSTNASSGGAQSGSETPTGGAKEKVVIAQATHGFLYTPVYIAQVKGYFEEEGLDVEVVIAGGGPKVLAALLGGGAQVGAGGVASVMEANKQGQNVQLFGSLMNEIASNVVMHKDVAAKLGITENSSVSEKIRALKGLKIGITTPGSSTDHLIRNLLQMENIDPDKDVELVPLSKSEAVLPALKNNIVDAFTFSSPTSDLAILDGSGMMLLNLSKGEVESIQGAVYQGLIATKDSIEKNKPLYEKVYRAIEKAEKFIESDKEGAKEALRKLFPDIDPSVFDSAYENNYNAFAKNPLITKESFELSAKFEGQDVPYEQVVNTSFFTQK